MPNNPAVALLPPIPIIRFYLLHPSHHIQYYSASTLLIILTIKRPNMTS